MKIIKKECINIETTDSHNGSGTRKLYLQPSEVDNVEGMTYGKLPVGNTFKWTVFFAIFDDTLGQNFADAGQGGKKLLVCGVNVDKFLVSLRSGAGIGCCACILWDPQRY